MYSPALAPYSNILDHIPDKILWSITSHSHYLIEGILWNFGRYAIFCAGESFFTIGTVADAYPCFGGRGGGYVVADGTAVTTS